MKRTYARFAGVMRTVHIYLTLFAFLLMMFFAVTGLILNHEDWIAGRTITKDTTGVIPPAVTQAPDKLMVVEHLRTDFGAIGAVSTFDTDSGTLRVELKGPGRRTEAEIVRATGKATVTIERHGFLMRLDDLHRGKDSGAAWKWVIDLSALLLFLGALTGILMWFALPRRRNWGIVALVASIIVAATVYLMVP